MSNNKNILTLVLDKADAVSWGNSDVASSREIIKRYINRLHCESYVISTCNRDTHTCNNPTIINTCVISIGGITAEISEENNTVTFSVANVVITGVTLPLSYRWIYDTTLFNPSGGTETNTLVLSPKVGKDLLSLSTEVQVEVTDKEGCVKTKSCFLVRGEMECADNYINCPNVSNFTVRSNTAYCVGVINLIVNKKS